MAIKPEQLDAEFQKRLDFFEDLIDRALTEKRGNYPDNINIDPPSGMSYADFQSIKLRYLNAGWGDVVWHDDQRDGTWISFHKNKQPGKGWMDR